MKVSEDFKLNEEVLKQATRSTEQAVCALVGEVARGAGKARQFAGDMADIVDSLKALNELKELIKPRAPKKKAAVK